MIDAVNTGPLDCVIEIGPGKGALTIPILKTGARVIAFELDERMCEYLSDICSEYIATGQLQIIHKDILEINMKDFFASIGPYKLIANIPYYITNAILRKFLDTQYQPTDMSLLMQREVAERIVVRDGKQSLLSLSVSVFGDSVYIAKVDRKYFSPQPKVHSAILAIHNISQDRFINSDFQSFFFLLLRAGFSHKRKQLVKNLQSIIATEDLRNILCEMNLAATIRAEELDRDQWLVFAHKLYNKNL